MSTTGRRVTPYRFGSAYRADELRLELRALQRCPANLPADFAESERFSTHYSQAIVAQELTGLPQPEGAYEQACQLIARYEFSDPRIVTGHFDSAQPLLGRTMLLEMRAFGFRFLGGVRVTAVRNRQTRDRSSFGFRYDTLSGHLECGSESFTVTKCHSTGDIWLRMSAAWRPGDFPTWWSRIGFAIVGGRYQRAWHRAAYLRMRSMLGAESLPQLPPLGRILRPGRTLTAAAAGGMGTRRSRPEIPSERGSLAR